MFLIIRIHITHSHIKTSQKYRFLKHNSKMDFAVFDDITYIKYIYVVTCSCLESYCIFTQKKMSHYPNMEILFCFVFVLFFCIVIFNFSLISVACAHTLCLLTTIRSWHHHSNMADFTADYCQKNKPGNTKPISTD